MVASDFKVSLEIISGLKLFNTSHGKAYIVTNKIDYHANHSCVIIVCR